MMTYHSLSVFISLLTALRLSTGLSFILSTPRPHHHVSPGNARSTTHDSLRLCAVSAPTGMAPGSLAAKRSARWSSPSRLCASEEGLGGEGGSVEEEQSSTPDDALLNAVGKVESPPAVDLAKGIAFEAPKAKVPAEEEEESESKKVRVVLYTVLSLVPFLLLLPFLGGRELMPLDPSQM